MPRTIPENRLKDLLECATRVFVAEGYRRTQIADVAAALGVAKGTVYLYVESKQALFEATLRYADGATPRASELDLPLSAAAPGTLESELSERLADEALPAALTCAAERRRLAGLDVGAELEEIVRALFATSSRHRTALKLIDRCGSDHPELARLVYGGGRFAQLDLLAGILERRVAKGLLPPLPDVRVAARFVIEAVATWAVHIHWDPAPQAIDAGIAEETLVRLVVSGLAGARG